MTTNEWKNPNMDEFDDITTNMWESSSTKKSKNKQDQILKRKAVSCTSLQIFQFDLISSTQPHGKGSFQLLVSWLVLSRWFARFCFDNPQIEKHLIISLGNLAYLALPKRGRLAPGKTLHHNKASRICRPLPDYPDETRAGIYNGWWRCVGRNHGK